VSLDTFLIFPASALFALAGLVREAVAATGDLDDLGVVEEAVAGTSPMSLPQSPAAVFNRLSH
jgi:hypothetical protein